MWGVAAVIVVVIIVFIAKQFTSSKDEQQVTSHNRTWLGFDPWTTEPVSQSAVQQLGDYLRDNYIDMVYLEVAAWNNDGALIEGEYASEFVQALHDTYPDVKVLVWLRMSGDQLAQPNARQAVLDLAARTVNEWNFDGAQLNCLGVTNGNSNYIQLVRDLRDTIGSDTVLSVTVPPDRTSADPILTWDAGYKQRVALLLIDEAVITAYASGLEDIESYQSWVGYQVENYAAVFSELDDPVNIIVALTTYDDAPGHIAAVEGLLPGIVGTRTGIQQAGKPGRLVHGIGLYEYKTTDSLELAIYRQNWLDLQ
jgi:hypothetical protein